MLGLNSSLLVLAHGGECGCVFFLLAPAPLIGFLIGCLRHGADHVVARWHYVLGYYLVTLGSLAYVMGVGQSASTPVTTAIFEGLAKVLIAATICGPFVGMWMIKASGPRRPRFRIGHCHSCGYNLTGNTSGICPECGEPIVVQPDYCVACGHTLLGLDSDACPECGTAVECPAVTGASANDPMERSSQSDGDNKT